MCGICGIAHHDPDFPADKRRLLAMRNTLTHRGPDDAGLYMAPGIGLGCVRLSIFDLSDRGHMPMPSPDGRYWITYNGEVYNYRELRRELEGRGESFRSNTDTEVVLRLYGLEGPEMLARLNGMFALGIWDTRERTLFLARDRLGVKPLCYAAQEGALLFASEEKSLFAGGLRREFDPGAWEELLCFRYVAGARTPFTGVSRLLPGHYLIWKQGQIQTRQWWNLADRARAVRPEIRNDPCGWFQETFHSAVKLRRLSDVPVGVLLSAGLDSGGIAVAMASEAGAGAASFTVRFPERTHDEGPQARLVAESCGLQHHELTVPTDRLLDLLQTGSYLNDGPLAHASDIHLLAISQFAKSQVTVLLSGEGADETLGGYVRYLPLLYPRMLDATRPFLPGAIALGNLNGRWAKLARFLALESTDRFVLFNACETLPPELEALGMTPRLEFPWREKVLAEAIELYPGEPVRQAMYLDHQTFLSSILRRTDRMTMGAGIECRVPFLDYRLVEGLAGLPSSVLFRGPRGKQLLRHAIESRVPRVVQHQRKWGFGVPWGAYFRQVPELRDWMRSLPESKALQAGPFETRQVRQVVQEFLGGAARYTSLATQLAMTAIWWDTYFSDIARRQPQPAPASEAQLVARAGAGGVS